VELRGDLFCPRQDAPQVYDSIFGELGLVVSAGLFSVNELVLRDFDLREISTKMLGSILPSSLRVLRTKNDVHLPNRLAQLMGPKGELNLQVFEFLDHCHDEPLHSDNMHGVESFCRSFSNPRFFTLEVSGEWESYDYHCLSSQAQLHTCVLSLGREYFTLDAVRTLRANHPGIKTFGLRAENMMSFGDHKEEMSVAGATWLQNLAKEMVQFAKLE
jgi:hypothetical protein